MGEREGVPGASRGPSAGERGAAGGAGVCLGSNFAALPQRSFLTPLFLLAPKAAAFCPQSPQPPCARGSRAPVSCFFRRKGGNRVSPAALAVPGTGREPGNHSRGPGCARARSRVFLRVHTCGGAHPTGTACAPRHPHVSSGWTHVCALTWTRVHTPLLTHTPTLTHTPLLTRMCLYSHAHTICTHLCPHAHACTHMHTPVLTHTDLYSHAHTYIHKHTLIFTHTPIFIRTHL